MLELYSKILQKSSILYDILQKRSVHFSYAVGKIHDFKKYLCDDLRTDAAFEICHADALAWPGGAPQRRCEQVINYKSLYFEVIDNIVGMIENRFRNVESFSFLDLVNPKIFPQLVDGVPVVRFNSSLRSMEPCLIFQTFKVNWLLFIRIRIFIRITLWSY